MRDHTMRTFVHHGEITRVYTHMVLAYVTQILGTYEYGTERKHGDAGKVAVLSSN